MKPQPLLDENLVVKLVQTNVCVHVALYMYVQCFPSICEKTSQATRAGFEPTTSCLPVQTS